MKYELTRNEIELIKSAINDLFHLSISKLGETNLSDLEEIQWIATKKLCSNLLNHFCKSANEYDKLKADNTLLLDALKDCLSLLEDYNEDIPNGAAIARKNAKEAIKQCESK